MNSTKIRNAARRRGITSLYHFTPSANLESILVNGLVSRRTEATLPSAAAAADAAENFAELFIGG